jgi:hypothetical protein
VETLRNWAADWAQAGLDGPVGCGEVAFLLSRTARLAEQIANDAPVEASADEMLPQSTEVTEPRPDVEAMTELRRG